MVKRPVAHHVATEADHTNHEALSIVMVRCQDLPDGLEPLEQPAATAPDLITMWKGVKGREGGAGAKYIPQHELYMVQNLPERGETDASVMETLLRP